MSEKTLRYVGKPNSRIRYLMSKKQDFLVVTTSKTTNIKTLTTNYLYADKHYFGKIFGLLAQLKKQLDANYEKIHNAPFSGKSSDVSYHKFESERNFRADAGTIYNIPDVIEADISMAYYRTLFNLGWITEDFYEKCKRLKKIDRLILVGSIATVKTIDTYIGGRKIRTDIEGRESIYRMAWFKVCSYVDSALITLMNRFNEISPDIFLFYWVDGIYFRNFEITKNYNWQTVFNEVSELFPFEWKYQRLKTLKVLNKDKKGLKIELVKANGEKKSFFPPKKEVRFYKLDKDGKPADIDSPSLAEMKRLYY